MTPAAVIDAALAVHIPTKKARAAIVGEHATHWGSYVAGHLTPGTAKVQAWLERCRAAGHPVVLEWDADGVSAG